MVVFQAAVNRLLIQLRLQARKLWHQAVRWAGFWSKLGDKEGT